MHTGQFLLGLAGGFLPLVIEAGDLADTIPTSLFSSMQAVGCLAYCAALLTATTCLASHRGRPVALGLIAGLLLTTALALLWAVLAAVTAH